MKLNRFFLLVIVGILAMASTAFAWEFSMQGDYEYRFRYISRTGPSDLFGNATLAQQSGVSMLTSIGLSGPVNGTVVPEGFSAKGSDGSYVQERFWVYPKFILNPAVSLQGIFAFQTSLNGLYQGGPNWINTPHYAGWYRSDSRSDTMKDATAVLALRALWATAETPLGTFKFGRRPFEWGIGWSGLHRRDTSNSSLSLDVPYGPLAFGLGAFLSSTGEASDPSDTRNVNRTPLTVASTNDRNETRNFDFYLSLLYRNGPLELGALDRTIAYNKVHAFPQPPGTFRDDMTGSIAQPFFLTSTTAGTDQTQFPVYGDFLLSNLVSYMKYFDGRFFFNAEYAIEWLKVRRLGGRPISGTPRSWALEGGGLWGPHKLSLAYFTRSGHDRQGGILDVSSSTGSQTTVRQVGDSWSQYIVLGGASSAIEPYGWLIGLYGTGNNSYDASGDPTYLDFKAFCARWDYALASNLNTWISAMIAKRQSNTGSWWGQYSGGVVPAQTIGSNVPDNNLGWEANVGIDWKLLEGLSWKIDFGYWQPGDWFKHAYVDLSLPTTIADGSGNNTTAFSANPNRGLDPIMGFQTSLIVAF
jgi:hypothetical protein